MISDSQARQQALDPTKSFLVQAPAGSGKTGLLVYRMLVLLATVEKPQQVLSITFTRKATAEMRARLLELLHAADRGDSSEQAFEQQGIDLARRVLERDALMGWGLLNAPHQLQIQTIDAFCAKLTSSMPWLSRLGERPRTTDQADAHYAAAVEQLLAELLDSSSPLVPSLKTVMSELDFNYNKARMLFGSMLARRDQWLRHLLVNDLGELRGELEAAWAGVAESAISRLETLLPRGMQQSLLDLCVGAAATLNNKTDQDTPFSSFDLWDQSMPTGLQQWRGVAHLLLTKEGFRKGRGVNIRLGFAAKSPAKERLVQILDEIADDYVLLDALMEVRALPAPNYEDADWSQLQALEQVLRSLAAYLQLRFRATGECDHSEVTQRANFALQELDNPTDLGLRLDYQLQHILVDEFQDTSQAQIELLKRLSMGWERGDGKTLFLVGDPMQSIYRFREADVSLFLQVAKNNTTQVFANIEVESLRLSENFRSAKTLVEWFNSTFAESFPASNDVLTGAIEYADASSGKPVESSDTHCLLAQNRAQEAELLAKTVKQAVESLPDATDKVAILVRSRSILEALLPALNAANIDYAGVDTQPLKELQAVIDVVALCKALCRHDDRVSWLSLLRGPWCGLTLYEIKQLVPEQNGSVWQQLQAAQGASVDNDAMQRLHRFSAVMRSALEQCQQVSLGQLTRWTWFNLGGPETLFGASQEDVETVFNLLDTLQRGGNLPSLKELEKGLDGLYAKPSQSDARVIVSTMHKAKGLQYHTVILPGLSSKPRADSKEVLMWAETQAESGDSRLLLAPFVMQSNAASHYEYLRRLENKRASNETMRLMYVACTRAEKRLVLLASANSDDDTGLAQPPAKNTLLSTVWGALDTSFTFTQTEAGIQHDSLTPTPSLVRLPTDFRPVFRSSIDWAVAQQLHAQLDSHDDNVEFEWATEVATGVGVVLHDWLQYQGEGVMTVSVDQTLIQRWRAELLALRVPESHLDYAVQRLRKAVTNIQDDQSVHFLFKSYSSASNEYAISAFENGAVNQYRIDRTFVDTHGVRWVVDYKSTDTNRKDVAGFAEEQIELRHRKQLEKYGKLMSQLDPRPIKLAVYFPLLKQLRSWDYVPGTDTETTE